MVEFGFPTHCSVGFSCSAPSVWSWIALIFWLLGMAAAGVVVVAAAGVAIAVVAATAHAIG
jgi:hypothetical protein